MTVEELYIAVIDAWNKRDATAYAELFTLDGDVVGFDGSQMIGRGMIAETLRDIFASHPTQPYVTRITGVTTVTTDVAIVRAIAGMAPAGDGKLDPKLHAIHRLTCVHRGGDWRAALFHNTPAALHGRPQDVEQMTRDLESR